MCKYFCLTSKADSFTVMINLLSFTFIAACDDSASVKYSQNFTFYTLWYNLISKWAKDTFKQNIEQNNNKKINLTISITFVLSSWSTFSSNQRACFGEFLSILPCGSSQGQSVRFRDFLRCSIRFMSELRLSHLRIFTDFVTPISWLNLSHCHVEWWMIIIV